MPWVRFDDQFPIHRKVKGLTDAEFRLHTEAIFWCARNLTDGYVARDELRDVSGIRMPERHLTALVFRGLWVETDDGWLINDYLSYQPSRSKVLHTREKRAEAGKKGGIRSGQSRRDGKPAGQPKVGSKTEANAKQVASHSLEHPARFLLKKERTGHARPPAAGPGGVPVEPVALEAVPNPDWRRMPAYGTQRDPADAERAAAKAAEIRASLRRPSRLELVRDPAGSLSALDAALAELPAPQEVPDAEAG